MQDELFLAETFRESFSIAWSHLQWWASVSFGLLALASFGRKHLNLVTTIGLSLLYLLFSVFVINNIAMMVFLGFAAQRQINLLSESGTVGEVGNYLSNASMMPGVPIPNPVVVLACFVLTLIGTLAYLWFAYLKNKRGAA